VKARVPASASVEVPDQSEQACGGGIQVRGQFGDLIAESLERRHGRRCGNQGGQLHRHDALLRLKRLYTLYSAPPAFAPAA